MNGAAVVECPDPQKIPPARKEGGKGTRKNDWRQDPRCRMDQKKKRRTQETTVKTFDGTVWTIGLCTRPLLPEPIPCIFSSHHGTYLTRLCPTTRPPQIRPANASPAIRQRGSEMQASSCQTGAPTQARPQGSSSAVLKVKDLP